MLISIKQINVSLAGKEILKNISFEMKPSEQWAFIGDSGAGKTTLAKAIAKKIFYRGEINIKKTDDPSEYINIEYIDQQHTFKNKFNTNQFYYQQRFNAADADATVTVMEELKETSSDENRIRYWTEIFSIHQHLDKSLLLLSNGENKRLQLTKAMLKSPDLLVLDNPFIGLDSTGRKTLADTLDILTKQGIKLILIAHELDLPNCITHVAIFREGELIECRIPIKPAITKTDDRDIKFISKSIPSNEYPSSLHFEKAIKMVNVNIAYDHKTILSNINWEVKKGEKWAISGPNGSGKSTLLSLVNADNPQAYANEIYLFDKRRGTGESIWDIKKNIGYVSPELHLYFDKGITCFQTIASGLFDTIGLFRKTTPKQDELIKKWMNVLEIDTLIQKPLQHLPMGKQRLVLLARALIKNPALLILDEPCQGLDSGQIEQFKRVIEAVCTNPKLTLLYVSHYESEWPKCIDKNLTMKNGTVITESARSL